MMVWIGRVRRLQLEELTEEEQERCRFLFGELVGLSRAHQPGYIEAFRQEFTADWDQYVADADRCLKQLVEARQRSESHAVRRKKGSCGGMRNANWPARKQPARFRSCGR